MLRSWKWLAALGAFAVVIPLAQNQLVPTPVPIETIPYAMDSPAAPPLPTPAFSGEPQVRASTLLSALISLTEGHLFEIVHQLELASTTEAVQSGDWNRILGVLSQVRSTTIDSALWYALPSGQYWTLEGNQEAASLSDRNYFPRVISGQRIMGDLVVSKSTGKSVAIVAIPIMASDGSIKGVLGASVFLDRLAALIGLELGADSSMIYYSFDSKPQLGMVWDPSLTLLDPHQISPEVGSAFDEMLRNAQGIQKYSFRGKDRTVVYQHSNVTGWWFAFGLVPGGRD
jgi:methyl-accepting chemotaxis protein